MFMPCLICFCICLCLPVLIFAIIYANPGQQAATEEQISRLKSVNYKNVKNVLFAFRSLRKWMRLLFWDVIIGILIMQLVLRGGLGLIIHVRYVEKV